MTIIIYDYDIVTIHHDITHFIYIYKICIIVNKYFDYYF